MTTQQLALIITRFYGVLGLILGTAFLLFWLAARLFPAGLNAISPYLSRYGTMSIQEALVHLLLGALLLGFSRKLAQFIARP